MSPLLLAVKAGIKQVAAKAFMDKVTEKMEDKYEDIKAKNTDGEVIALTNVIEKAVISKKKTSAWVGVVSAILYFASAKGYIDPALAELVNSILSNPDTVEAIETLAE